MPDYPVAPVNKLGRDSINALSQKLITLTKSLEELSARLAPLSRPVPATAALKQSPPAGSELGSQLFSMCEVVDEQNMSVNNMIDLLDF